MNNFFCVCSPIVKFYGLFLGPVLSRTGSVERSYEDQLLKDLQDSIERENDLKEQLNMVNFNDDPFIC